MQGVPTSAHALEGVQREVVEAQIHVNVVSGVVDYFENLLLRYRLLLQLLLLLHLLLLLLLLKLHLAHADLELLFELLLPLQLSAFDLRLKESSCLCVNCIFDLFRHISEVESVLALGILFELLHLDLLRQPLLTLVFLGNLCVSLRNSSLELLLLRHR